MFQRWSQNGHAESLFQLAAGKVQKTHARDGQVKCYKIFIPVIEIAQVCAKFLVDSILEEINMLLLPQMD